MSASIESIDESNPNLVNSNLHQGRVLFLACGRSVLISDADFKRVSRLRWHITGAKGNRYVAARDGARKVLMHRFILQVEPGLTVDHINGDPLDNRRENLRPATYSQQAMNRRAVSGAWAKGLSRHRRKWRVRVSQGSCCCQTLFYSRALAAMWYDAAARRRFGQFARPNFDESISGERAAELIASSGGRIFSVVFSRRDDGREREMTCRTGVGVCLKGASLRFDPLDRGLIPVFDVQINDYRFIPKERILCMRINKTRYAVDHCEQLN